LPKDADAYFSRPKEEQTYYSWVWFSVREFYLKMFNKRIIYLNYSLINNQTKFGLFQSNFVLVTGITLLIPFNNFSDTSWYISSNPS
jgi:hypothetical protein